MKDDQLPEELEHAEWLLEHIFLKTSDSTESRITRKSQPGLTTYHHRVQGEQVNGEQSISERTLSVREFKALLKNADPDRTTIKKTRRAFIWGNEYYLLDTFHSPKEAKGTTTLFVEKALTKGGEPLPDSDDDFPPFLRLRDDVTTKKWFSSKAHDSYQRTIAMAEDLAIRRRPTTVHESRHPATRHDGE